MSGYHILSPMPMGNGAYIIHKQLEKDIKGYSVQGYHPLFTLCPVTLKAVVRPNRSDLLHTTPDYAFFFMQPSIPAVVTFHNYVLDAEMRPYNSTLQNIHYRTDLRLFTKLAIARAHTLTAVSRYTATVAKRDLGLTQDIKVIYNGIDAEHFRPALSRRQRGHVRVFFSGNLSRRKGAHWLAEIAGKLNRHITLHYTSGLRDNAAVGSGPNLVPVGSIPFADMPAYYGQMDILVMPTVREGFGLAVAEAMACGLPVVASNCSAIPELVDHGKGGFLCPVGAVDVFAEKINLLADSPGLRQAMGEYNRSRIEKEFTVQRMVKEYEALFNETLENG